jgi:hypothetical protein
LLPPSHRNEITPGEEKACLNQRRKMTPATITLFLVKGDAKGLRTASIGNWSGKAIAAPRTEFEDLLARDELALSGIYLLLGVDLSSGDSTAYIGEGEVVRKRLATQQAREFTSAIVFVSAEFSKAHVKYLEGRLLLEAQAIDRVKLQNSVCSGARLRECDVADMEIYLSRIRQLLPILGSDLLTPVVQPLNSDKSPTLYCRVGLAEARGQRTSGGFVVFRGSTAVAQERPGAAKHKPHIVAIRKQLISTKKLVPADQLLRFAKDVEFGSSSAAASVICGGAAAGPLKWRDQQGTTLKELDEQFGAAQTATGTRRVQR